MKIIKINNVTLFLFLILLLTGYIRVGIIISIIVVFHELGHILFIKLFKCKIISVTFYPFGGLIKTSNDLNFSVNKELLIASGGIIFQCILFIVIFFMPLSVSDKMYFYKYNTSIMIFNILPIIPLDGSVIIRSILNKIFSFKLSFYMYIAISFISIIIYFVINYYFNLNNYLIVMLFLYKTINYYRNFKFIYQRFLLERYLNNYRYKKISTKSGSIDILMLDTYQYFKENGKIIGEKKKLAGLFLIDKT